MTKWRWAAFALVAGSAAAAGGACAGAPEPAQAGSGIAAPAAADACIPAGHDRASLAALKADGFAIGDDATRQAFARAIVACLASPDPDLRDGVAFEALSVMARVRALSAETMKAINADLYSRMDTPDAGGFQPPFAALALSEMARADRIEAYLGEDELAQMLEAARRYLTGVSDYRGFDADEGWRHGVAHGADVMLQLTLNPRVGREGLEAIRTAVAAQAAPSTHAYVHGEAERLARPILFMARRGVFSEAEWSTWLADAAGPGASGRWEGAFASEASLARRHNAMAFLSALWVNVTLGEETADDVLKPGLEAALRALP
jgi:hypothetical protein